MTEQPRPLILLIEDDESVKDMLSLPLESEGCGLAWVQDGETGVAQALAVSYDLVILDLQLPRLGGVEVCRRIRKARPALPIIMLTSRDTELDKVIGLDAGADDYVTKPFRIYELLARIRSRLRASAALALPQDVTKDVMDFGPLVIDRTGRRVLMNGGPVELTAMEFDLLTLLASQPGRVFTREALLEAVCDVTASCYAENLSHIVYRMRRKLEPDPANPRYVETVRGVGYRFAERVPSGAAAAEASRPGGASADLPPDDQNE